MFSAKYSLGSFDSSGPRLQPVAVPVERVVHAIHEVRHPAGIGLDADHLEVRVALEDAAEDEHGHDVLAAPHDGQEAADLRAPGLLALRSQDVEAQRQVELDGGLPERVVHRRVVVLHRRQARHHHPAQPQCLDGLQVLDALLRGAHRGLAAAQEPVRRVGAVVGDPAVVGVEGRLLQVVVVDVAEHHAHRGVDDLGGDAVGILLGEPRRRVPSTAVELLEAGALGADLGGVLAGGGDQTHGDRHRGTLHHEHVAHRVATVHHVWSTVAPGRVDEVGVGVRRLGDVRVGGDDRVVDLHVRIPLGSERHGVALERATEHASPRTRGQGLVDTRG